MRHRLRTTLLATAIALAGVTPLLSPDAAQAQSYRGYSHRNYRDFHRILARYGDWVYSDRWGTVWIPDVSDNFRPYRTAGYWVNTRQYGWFWRSSYPWGDITFHYGRWVNDPYDGWLWIPGYVWSPGWVVWRGNNRYIGWMPMPPDRDFLRGNETSFSFSVGGGGISLRFGQGSDFYGYGSWYGRDYDRDRFASNWTFVGAGSLGDRDYGRTVVNQTNVVNVIQNTTNITNYTVVNNVVVNRSVDARVVERASGRPVATVNAATVVNPTLVTRVDEARQVQMQAPAPIARGTGQANSAPQPTAAVVSTLTDKPVERRGRKATGLFNRQTVQSAPLAPRAPAAGTAPAAQPPTNVAPATTPTSPTATPAAPTQNAPAASAPPTNTPPAETGGRNRERNRGNRGEQNAPQGNETPPAQNAPAATAPSTNNPPAETGGRNRERNRGNRGEQGAPQNAPAATAPGVNPPPANTAQPDNGTDNRHKKKKNRNDTDNTDNQGTNAPN